MFSSPLNTGMEKRLCCSALSSIRVSQPKNEILCSMRARLGKTLNRHRANSHWNPFFFSFFCFPTPHLWCKLLFGWHLVPAGVILCAISILCTRRDGCIMWPRYNCAPGQGEFRSPKPRLGGMNGLHGAGFTAPQTESIHCSQDFVQVLRHEGFVGDKEMMEKLGECFNYILVCGNCFSDSWKEWLSMCAVMPLNKAKLSWGDGRSFSNRDRQAPKWPHQWHPLLLGCPEATPAQPSLPKAAEFRICPDVSANTPVEQFRGLSPNPWEGHRSCGCHCHRWEAQHRLGKGPCAQPLSCCCVPDFKGSNWEVSRASALLFIFSNAHKLSTNNLSYQVSE